MKWVNQNSETHSKPSNDRGETDHLSEFSCYKSLDDNTLHQCVGEPGVFSAKWLTSLTPGSILLIWLSSLPHTCMCVYPKTAHSVKEDGVP